MIHHRRILALTVSLLTLLATSSISAQTASIHVLPKAKVINSTYVPSDKDREKITDLENRYRAIHRLEQFRLYKDAREKYTQILESFLKQSDAVPSDPQWIAYLPVMISSAFRLGVVTSRDCYSNMYQLGQQIEFFSNTQDLIDALLGRVIALRSASPDLLDQDQYNDLLFARGYNRIGWSGKLMAGIPWKNYVVYPPADVVRMLNASRDDFTQLLSLENLPLMTGSDTHTPTPAEQNAVAQIYLTHFISKVHALESQSNLFKTMQLTNLEDNPEKLAQIIAKRYYHNARDFVIAMDSPKIQKSLSLVENHYDIDRLLAPESTELFTAVQSLLTIVDLDR